MDIEERALNALMRLPVSEAVEAAVSMAGQADIFVAYKTEFEWLREHIIKHGKPPSKALVQRRFPDMDCRPVKDAFSALHEELIERKQKNIIVDMINDIGTDTLLADDPKACFQKVDEAMALVHAFDTKAADSEYVTSAQQRMDRYSDRAANFSSNAFTLGAARMDAHIGGGFVAPQLVVLAGDPGLGKSWMLIQAAAANYAQGKRVMIITPELDRAQIEDRMDAMRYQLSYDDLRRGQLSPKALARYKNQMKKDTLPLHIIDTTEDPVFTPSRVASKVERYQPQIVLIDSAYYLEADNVSRNDAGYKTSQNLCKQLKNVCKRHSIPIMVVVQMDRESERRDVAADKAGRHIYGGDAWMQAADVLLRLTGKRDQKYRRLQCLKQREGECFCEDLLRFEFDPCPEIESIQNISFEEVPDDDTVEVDID